MTTHKQVSQASFRTPVETRVKTAVKVAAVFFLLKFGVEGIMNAAYSQDNKKGKGQSGQGVDSTALAKFESIKQKFMGERAKNGVAVLYGPTIITEIPERDSKGNYCVTDPKRGPLIVLSADEFKNAENGTKPRGQSFLVYKSEDKMYLAEVTYQSM
jgi:hypothetical protein